MSFLDKLARKRFEQSINQNIKRAQKQMAAGKYQEAPEVLAMMQKQQGGAACGGSAAEDCGRERSRW